MRTILKSIILLIFQICGKISPNIKALRSHILIHEKPKYECIVCGKGFRHSGKLRVNNHKHYGNFSKNTRFSHCFPCISRSIPIFIAVRWMHMNVISVERNSVSVHLGRRIAWNIIQKKWANQLNVWNGFVTMPLKFDRTTIKVRINKSNLMYRANNFALFSHISADILLINKKTS